jgi:hypothetical protein
MGKMGTEPDFAPIGNGLQPIEGYMIDKAEVIQTNEQLTAVIHQTVPRAEISNAMLLVKLTCRTPHPPWLVSRPRP